MFLWVECFHVLLVWFGGSSPRKWWRSICVGLLSGSTSCFFVFFFFLGGGGGGLELLEEETARSRGRADSIGWLDFLFD